MHAILRYAPLTLLALQLTGCGLYVPEFQENPFDKVGGQQLVQSIVYNITCEVQDAVAEIYNNQNHPREHTFLDTWGANIALNLQVDEKSIVAPATNYLPKSPATSVFNLNAGLTGSAELTRQDKLNSYYTIAQLRALGPCIPGSRPGGLLLLQSDLGLEEWLRDNVTAADTGEIAYGADYADGPLKTNVLSHEIKFDITTGGNITPGWKLTRATIDQTGTLFSATRDRTNDLTITLGPTVSTPKPKTDKKGQPLLDLRGRPLMVKTYGPSDPASEAALASQIGLAVSNALKGSPAPPF